MVITDTLVAALLILLAPAAGAVFCLLFGRGQTPAIRNLNVEIAAGELVVVTGHSGAGKSTLLDLITGELELQFGSITIDGVSLTVNDVRDRPDGSCDFALNLIPHTGEVTTLGDLREGSRVNLEIDVLARYLQRMRALDRA